MSYILNALRKSEQARRALQVDALPSVPLIPAKNHSSRRVSPIMGLFVLLNVFALAYLFIKLQAPLQAVVAPAPVNSLPIIKPIEQPSIARDKVESTSLLLPSAKDSQAISALWNAQQKQVQDDTLKMLVSKPAPVVKKKVLSVVVPKEPVAVVKRKVAVDTVNVLRKKVAESLVVSNADQSEETAEPVNNTVREAPTGVSSNKSNAPLLSELPVDFQGRVSLGTLNVFAYSDNPSQRFVIIDMVKYKAGQRIKQKASVLDILPTYVLLQFEGQNFRLDRP
ncbi:MAG: general secretion pathway protein GspB [Methylococcales bacterium]|nr:general secretion pathway protein GspB [Methylococcales bacterium]